MLDALFELDRRGRTGVDCRSLCYFPLKVFQALARILFLVNRPNHSPTRSAISRYSRELNAVCGKQLLPHTHNENITDSTICKTKTSYLSNRRCAFGVMLAHPNPCTDTDTSPFPPLAGAHRAIVQRQHRHAHRAAHRRCALPPSWPSRPCCWCWRRCRENDRPGRVPRHPVEVGEFRFDARERAA